MTSVAKHAFYYATALAFLAVLLSACGDHGNALPTGDDLSGSTTDALAADVDLANGSTPDGGVLPDLAPPITLATRFAPAALDWPVPANTYTTGFDRVDQDSPPTWRTTDLDGDGKPDLVVIRDEHGDNFGPDSAQRWHVYKNTGTGFATAPIDWTIPDVGQAGNIGAFSQTHTSGVRWVLRDMDADGKLDLLTTSGANDHPHKNAAGKDVWHVYKNTGTGFATTALEWSLPDAGVFNGFYAPDRYQFLATEWYSLDLTGDGRPDLLLTTDDSGKNFGPPTAQSWRVYTGTATGFAATATIWSLPDAGLAGGFSPQGAAGTIGRWRLIDMDHDGKRDLVLFTGTIGKVFGSPTAQSWKVYRNLGSGFAATATTFTVGNAGLPSGVYDVGSDAAADGDWAVQDLNGDGLPDVVITSGANGALYGTAASQVWHVLSNTGSGFAPLADWALPNASLASGFPSTAGTPYDGEMKPRWVTRDLDGDGKADLVLTADGMGNIFGPKTNEVWKVYLGE